MVLRLSSQPVELQQATGWYAITTTRRPPDTDTTTYDRSVAIVNGVPTETWTARPWTPDGLAAHLAAINRAVIDEAITDAVTELDEIPDGTLTTAELSDIVRTVAATLKRTIRLVRGDFDGTD